MPSWLPDAPLAYGKPPARLQLARRLSLPLLMGLRPGSWPSPLKQELEVDAGAVSADTEEQIRPDIKCRVTDWPEHHQYRFLEGRAYSHWVW
jgi:hypothetical protein